MTTDREPLAELLVATHRLTRIAARSTGSMTPSAVWSTLSILTTDGPQRVGELASAVRISQPGMTKVVRQLVDDNFARRITDADDARAWVIDVTPAGIDALNDWRTTLTKALQPLFAGLSDDERETLAKAANILSAATAPHTKVTR